MARATVTMPTATLDALARAGSSLDEHAQAALQAGASVVEPVMRANLAGVITPASGTGQLLGALGVSTVKVDRQGNHNIKVGFDEPRRDGTINALVATVLEYGSSPAALLRSGCPCSPSSPCPPRSPSPHHWVMT